jgi:hypothetical protein
MIDNRILKPISSFIATERLSWNAQTLVYSVDLAMVYSVIPDITLETVEKVARVYAGIIKLRLTGVDRNHPIRKGFNEEVFVDNTIKTFTFIKNQMQVSDSAMFKGLLAIQKKMYEEEE